MPSHHANSNQEISLKRCNNKVSELACVIGPPAQGEGRIVED